MEQSSTDDPELKSDDADFKSDESPETDEESSRSRSWWWLYLLVGILGLPSLLTVTGSASSILKFVHPDLARVTTFDHVALHWWSPVEIRELRVRNTRDDAATLPELLRIPSLRTTEPLWKIAFQMGRGVHVQINRPELGLMTTEDGSNVRQAMTDLLGSSPTEGPAFPIDVTIEDGRVHIVRATTDPEQPYELRPLLADVDCRVSTLDPSALLPDISLAAQASGKHAAVAAVDVAPRQLAGVPGVDNNMPPNITLQVGSSDETGSRTVALDVAELDLAGVDGLLHQFFPDSEFAGVVSIQANAHLLGSQTEDGVALQLTVQGHGVQWRQNGWADGETLQFGKSTLQAAVAVAEDAVIVTDLSVDTPVGQIRGDGEISIATDRLLDSIVSGRRLDESLARESAVAEAEAASGGQVRLNGELDLAAIGRMLPRTLHLQEGMVPDRASIRFSAKAQPADRLQSQDAELQWKLIAESTEFQAEHDGRPIRWDSPVRLQAGGPLSLHDAGVEEIVVSGDFGQATLTPVAASRRSSTEAVAVGSLPPGNHWDVDGKIDIDQLWNGIGQFVDLPQPGIRGQATIHASVAQPEPGILHFSAVRFQADNLRIASNDMLVRTDRPLMQMLNGQASVDGSGAAIRSLAAPWIDLSALAEESAVHATLDASPADHFTLQADIRPGEVASRSPGRQQFADTLRIDNGRLALQVSAESTADRYLIRQGLVEFPGLEVRLQGTLETLGNWMTTDLVVDARYDLSRLGALLPEIAGQPIRISGQHTDRMLVRGAPAFWSGSAPEGIEPLTITGEMVWDSAEALGLRLAKGTAPFEFSNGHLRTEPIHCGVNDGQLSVMLDYDVAAHGIAVASGSRIENLSLTPELTAQWMGYVAPFLADAAGVSGSVSARVSEFRLDLNRPDHNVIAGIVDIHGITASPGGSLVTLLQALDQLRPGRRSAVRDLEFPEQRVPFQLRDGVIAHEDLHMTVTGYDVRSRGSVGLNEQVRLLLDVPLERSSEQPSSRKIQVPVGGTMRRPQVDVARLIRDEGQRQIQGRINDEFDKGLKGLFDKLR